jgi:siroheme synthase
MALLSKAATPDQVVVVTTLSECVAAARLPGIEAPVLIAVGDVVALRSSLDWFDKSELGTMPPFEHKV